MKVIFWDFDGVIINSDKVRVKGFEEVLKDFDSSEVEALLAFHRANGGLSRYVKFRYFFEEIRKESVTEEQIIAMATDFSVIMKKLLTNPSLLISETMSFIKNNRAETMYIVSGSDQTELRYLCEELDIAQYFESIHGSPTSKNDLVKGILDDKGYDPSDCILIGDSINDYEAAMINNIAFCGFGNEEIIARTNKKVDFSK